MKEPIGKRSMLGCRYCISRKDGIAGGGWGHPYGDIHTVAARLGIERAMISVV